MFILAINHQSPPLEMAHLFAVRREESVRLRGSCLHTAATTWVRPYGSLTLLTLVLYNVIRIKCASNKKICTEFFRMLNMHV